MRPALPRRSGPGGSPPTGATPPASTLGYAPGEERHAHTNTERLSLAEARRVYDAYPALIRALFGAL
jgi:hypothetical protein